jgi:hypothetical protein
MPSLNRKRLVIKPERAKALMSPTDFFFTSYTLFAVPSSFRIETTDERPRCGSESAFTSIQRRFAGRSGIMEVGSVFAVMAPTS